MRIDGREEHGCETPEEVGRVISEYQMDEPGDPDLNGITIVERDTGRRLPPQHFLPQQIP